jgi:DNA-binding NtrC family response regulator
LAERLKADNPELKVLYSSGYSTDLLGKDLALKEGINFLQKPYPPSKLLQTVRNALGIV